MRLLDTYGLYCGAKIDRPFIYESYLPLPFDKYITFQAQTPYDSRNYAYWQDVLDIIIPVLHGKGIKVVQLGLGSEAPYQRIVDLRGQTNMHQLAYVIRRSMLHFGPDSFGIHLACAYDIPLVSLYSISMTEVSGPHFGSPEKQILFKGYERVGNKKPSYAVQENPKSINTIKPEEVAGAIFKLLGIDYQIPFESVFFGARYSHQMIREMIPNTPHYMPNPEHPVELRLDLFYDEKLLAHHLNYWHKAVLVTDKPLPTNLLRHFKSHIALVAYHLADNEDAEFAKNVVNLGIPLVLLSKLPDNELQAKKVKYYEFGAINRAPVPDEKTIEKLRPNLDKLYYRSCKLIASNGKVFGSHADVEANVPLKEDFEYHKVIDSPNFWQDLDFYTIVKKL